MEGMSPGNEAVDPLLERGGRILEKGIRLFAHLSGYAVDPAEVIQDLRQKNKNDIIRWAATLRKITVARVLFTVASSLSTGPASADHVAAIFKDAYALARSAERTQAHMLVQAVAQPEIPAFTTFLEQIREPVEKIRALFPPTDDATRWALRFAFANVFVPYGNVIATQGFERDPRYRAALTELLGSSPRLDEFIIAEEKRRATSLPSPDEDRQFKHRLFTIYESEPFRELQGYIGDSKQLFYYEVLSYPNAAVEFPRLYADAKKNISMKVLSLVEPETLPEYRALRHEVGDKIPLDNPTA